MSRIEYLILAAKLLPRCYSVLACCLRCRGLRDSFAVKATLKISDWHWHWHWQTTVLAT